jgi:hypothetical protein
MIKKQLFNFATSANGNLQEGFKIEGVTFFRPSAG